MLEIKGTENFEKKIAKKMDERKIVFDKANRNNPFQILYKPLKLNTNEIEKLGIDSGDLNLLTISYTKEDGTKDEFILGDLTNIEIREGKNDISNYMRKINITISQIYNKERPSVIASRINEFIHTLKNDLQRYQPKYTPEGYSFVEDYGKIFEARKSVSVVSDPESFDNIEIYDDIRIDSRFNSPNYYQTHSKIEGTFIEELKQATNTEREIAASINKFEEYKDYSEIEKYLADLKESEQVAEFFKTNVDILNRVISNNPDLQGLLENIRAKKTPSKGAANRTLGDAAFKIVKEEVGNGNLEYIKMIVIPEEKDKEI